VPASADNFASLVRGLRRDAGRTQEELAEQAGISARAISDLERGVTRAYSPDTNTCKAGVLDADNSITLFGGPVCLDYASRSSTDNFRKETRLSTQSSNPYLQFAGSFIGDYTGVVVDGPGAAWAAAMDDRGNPGVTSPNRDQVVFRAF